MAILYCQSEPRAFFGAVLLWGELNNVIQIRIPSLKITALKSLTLCQFFFPLGWIIAVLARAPVECRTTTSDMATSV
jgi:hypothetical protein